MSEIDVSGWKKFRVGDLFNLVNSKPYHALKLDLDDKPADDRINYITRRMVNNGLTGYALNRDDFVVNPAGTISFGAENADFFYQEEPYITGNKMYYVDTRELTRNAALFVRSVFESTFAGEFSYGNGLIPSRIVNAKISLPATPTGDPDWDYMDSYMSRILERETPYADHFATISGGGGSMM